MGRGLGLVLYKVSISRALSVDQFYQRVADVFAGERVNDAADKNRYPEYDHAGGNPEGETVP